MIKIVLHGSLKSRFPSFSVEAESAGEAIEAWSNQTDMRNLPWNQKPIIDVVGFSTLEALSEKTEIEELHLIQRLAGGGGIGKVLLGAAFIGLSFIPGLGQIGQIAISTVLFSTGIGLMLGGIMQLVMPTPKLDNKNNGPESSKYLSAGNNSTKIGTPITRGYGRYKLGGQYLSIQVNAADMVYGQFPETL